MIAVLYGLLLGLDRSGLAFNCDLPIPKHGLRL